MRLLFILLIISGCFHTSIDTNNINIYQTPRNSLVIEAIEIIVEEFDKNNIYTSKRMFEVINSINLENHTTACSSNGHKLNIVFQRGEWSEKDAGYCIFVSKYPGVCCGGLFNTKHTITMTSSDYIYKTALAHELFHYFQQYIDGKKIDSSSFEAMHQPTELWENLVGYKVNKLGIIREALKEKGL